MRIKVLCAIALVAAISLPAGAEKIAAYLLSMSMGPGSVWTITNNYNSRIYFVINDAEGENDFGAIPAGGSYNTRINSGKLYHIYACDYPETPKDSSTGQFPTFGTTDWSCSR